MGVVGFDLLPPTVSSVRIERVRLRRWAKRGLCFLEFSVPVESVTIAESDKMEGPEGRWAFPMPSESACPTQSACELQILTFHDSPPGISKEREFSVERLRSGVDPGLLWREYRVVSPESVSCRGMSSETCLIVGSRLSNMFEDFAALRFAKSDLEWSRPCLGPCFGTDGIGGSDVKACAPDSGCSSGSFESSLVPLACLCGLSSVAPTC